MSNFQLGNTDTVLVPQSALEPTDGKDFGQKKCIGPNSEVVILFELLEIVWFSVTEMP